MQKIGEIYQDYLNKTYKDRVKQGKEEIATVREGITNITKQFTNEELNYLIIMVCKNFIGADGSFSNNEFDFLKDTFGLSISYNELLANLNNLPISLKLQPKDFICSLDEQIKFALLRYGILLCVADGKLTVDEQTEIEKFIN